MQKQSNRSQQDLEKSLGLCFKQPQLLTRALTHCSFSTEHMERLEFLGDAVLGVVVAEYLHDRFPVEAEGQLSRLRAALVRKESLFIVAQSWHLASYLRVGEGERNQQGVKSNSIVANAVESVIGALFKDAGWDAAKALILQAWKPLFEGLDCEDARDSKSQLQEYTQAKAWGLPIYEVEDLGIGQEPRFKACCLVKQQSYGVGLGNRKKTAELAAASSALAALKLKFGEIV
ncbi:MAG: ribonuclease III [Mariprofundaceae bacterium]